jgi:hypothetical protein
MSIPVHGLGFVHPIVPLVVVEELLHIHPQLNPNKSYKNGPMLEAREI